MDIVITYVNGLDPVWQKDYQHYTNIPPLVKRFRDWGTLRYLMRGIECNMPFVRRVHLVVSHESQVPEWVDRSEVNVVLHKDIIPAQALPTFNCNPIEMCLHRIEGLDEEFLYFNDDMYPMLLCKPEDFFREGKGVIGISRHWFPSNMYKHICRNSDRLARKALGLKPSWTFLRPQHICSPLLKSECKALYATIEQEIKSSLTRIRTKDDLNQYLFLDYMYLKGKIINLRQSKKHFSVGVTSPDKLHRFILHPTKKLACINDVQLTEERYVELRKTILLAFEQRFPNRSKFEIL